MTPIERAARAMAKRHGQMLYDNGASNKPASQHADERWRDHVSEARIVIAAIREPGSDIYQAGFDAEATANPHKTQPHHVVPAVWSAMIDALLVDDPSTATATITLTGDPNWEQNYPPL